MDGLSLLNYVRPIASGQKYKNVSIYDGFKFLLPPTNQTESIDINISGFLTPLSQVPTGSMAFYAMGAEKQLTGEKVKLSNNFQHYSIKKGLRNWQPFDVSNDFFL